ncbi:MAG: hypothetical protein EOO24_55005 [Comamonadaceae bacterium]|nr:MAG: hypothetical protein EOO24_55005 [Comamonadaceae bacterium]
MERYGNRSGKSGVVAYGIHADAIDVTFVDGVTYRYTHARPGRAHVEAMKTLALAGSGLSGYIARYVREAYDGKSA